MKQPSDYNSPIALRPDTWLEEQLNLRASASEKQTPGKIAKRDLGRLYALYRLALPKFSFEEALVLVEILRITDLKPETAHLLPAIVRASPHIVDEELDAEFLVKLDKMSLLEYMAIVDAVERFWRADGSRSVQARLQEVGLTN